MRNFLSHKVCQSLMDDWFKGGFPGSSMQLKENDSMMILWFYLLLPPFNPYLYTNSGDGGSGSSLSMDSVAAVSSALMAAHRLAKMEMKNAGGDLPTIEIGKGKPPRLQAIVNMAESTGHTMRGMPERSQEKVSLRETVTKVAAFYSTPAVKMLVRASTHILLMVSYARVLFEVKTSEAVAAEGVPRLDWFEIVFGIFAACNFIDMAHSHMRLKSYGFKPLANFDRILRVADTTLLLAGICRIVSLFVPAAYGQSNIYSLYQLALSYNVIIYSFHTINFCTIDPNFGVLVITVEQMMGDLMLFMSLAGLILSGFLLALIGLTQWDIDEVDLDMGVRVDRSLHSATGSGDLIRADASRGEALRDFTEDEHPTWRVLTIAAWAIFGNLQLDFVEQYVPYGQPVVFGYAFMVMIVLVNLLVAMFADTYSRITQNSEMEFRFQMKYYTFVYQKIVHALPPPLNLPWILPVLISSCFRKKRLMNDTTTRLDAHALNAMGLSESSIYMGRYLKMKEEAEARTVVGLATATRERVEQAQQAQMNTTDLLKDIQKTVLANAATPAAPPPPPSAITSATAGAAAIDTAALSDIVALQINARLNVMEAKIDAKLASLPSPASSGIQQGFDALAAQLTAVEAKLAALPTLRPPSAMSFAKPDDGNN